MNSKDLIVETLEYWKYKVEANACTMEEMQKLSEIVDKELNINGTVEDFAKFYDKPEQAVRNVIHRKVLDKPKRRVYYKFLPFLKSIPDKWLKDR